MVDREAKGWGEIHYQSRCFPGVPYVSFTTLLKCKPTKWAGGNGSANSCLRFHNRFIDSKGNDPSDYRNIPAAENQILLPYSGYVSPAVFLLASLFFIVRKIRNFSSPFLYLVTFSWYITPFSRKCEKIEFFRAAKQ